MKAMMAVKKPQFDERKQKSGLVFCSDFRSHPVHFESSKNYLTLSINQGGGKVTTPF